MTTLTGVCIVNYQKRQAEDGREFFALELSGGVERVLSKETGGYYLTSKKTSVPSTFDEETCKSLIGTKMEGNVVRQEVEPYTHIVKETGEELTLSHRWVYVPEEDAVSSKEEEFKADANVFSQNGIHELAEQAI